MKRELSFTVGAELAGKTVKTILRDHAGISGTVLKRAKRIAGGICLNGVPVFVNVPAACGDVLRITLEAGESASDIMPVEGEIDIVFEDEDLLIVNKPPNMVVHPVHGHRTDSLANRVLWYFGDAPFVFRSVNRLDKGTSGLIVIAKNATAQTKLIEQLHTEAFVREYLAVVDGAPHPACGIIDAPIARKEGSAIERTVCAQGAAAITQYETLQEGERSLVKLTLQTGRTHQIRVHMQHIGCPLTGDFLYGTENPALIARPALHSYRIAFLHPFTKKRHSFCAELPEDMKKLIEQ